MQHKTSTGTIESIKTFRGVLIRLFNESTNRKIGITIPDRFITSFLRRWFFQGSYESIEVNIKNDMITIIGITNFGRDIPTSVTISRSTWAQIESEIREMI